MNKTPFLGVVLLGLYSVTAGAATADESTEASSADSQSWVSTLGSKLSIGGFIRSETAFSTSGATKNMFNQNGDPYNGVATPRDGLYPDTTTRNGRNDSQDINLQLFRGEVETKMRISNSFSATARVRAIFDPAWYKEYDPSDIDSQASGRLNERPDYFRYNVEGSSHPQPLEWTGRRYQVGFPTLVLQYDRGPLTVRAGMQQIAWGQAIFFRVLDVPDGLDLRRHSLLDVAADEFSDKRVAAPGIRTTYSFGGDWLADAYVQKFQPTVYSNPNTPYNAIGSQFTVHDRYAEVDNKLDLGLRLKRDTGALGLQAIYAHRYNPDGVFRWTESGVNRDIPGLVGSGEAMQHTPLEVDPSGVWSADEWFAYSAASRLDGVEALNAIVTDFQPYTGALGAYTVSDYDSAHRELDIFMQLAGGALNATNNSGLRGHIERKYKRENNFGLGASYVVSAGPGSLLDQLIINLEAMYVPNRTFTSPSLGVDYVRKPEWTVALVLEKYQRFSVAFPATYMVGQVLYKSQSDIFGRYLGGMGGDENHAAPGVDGGFQAVVLALQQPFPNLIWRADVSALYDVRGGLLLQPAVRWKPLGAVTLEAYYNYLNGHIGNDTENFISTVDYADEIGMRLAYQF